MPAEPMIAVLERLMERADIIRMQLLSGTLDMVEEHVLTLELYQVENEIKTVGPLAYAERRWM